MDTVRWLWVLCFAALPWVSAALCLLLTRLHPPTRHSMAEPAGDWLSAEVRRLQLGVRVELGDQDGYLPGARAITLRRSSWRSKGSDAHAIAAHELGHALHASQPALAQILPAARLGSVLGWRGLVAVLAVATLTGQVQLLWLGLASGLLGLLAGIVVLVDEGAASVRGLGHLPEAPPRVLQSIRRMMAGSWAVYASGVLAQGVGLWALPRMALGISPGAPGALSTPGVLLLLVALPFLLLRAAQVSLQVLVPEPVESSFRLFSTLYDERQWEGAAALVVFALVVLLHPALQGPLNALALCAAGLALVGPLAEIGRALAALPVLVAARWAGALPRSWFEEPGPDVSAEALMELYSDPPWTLRLSWLLRIAWLPLLGLMVLRLLRG